MLAGFRVMACAMFRQIEPPPGLGVAGPDVQAGSPDDSVRKLLSVLELDTFIAYVCEEVERRCIEDSKLFSQYVEKKMTWLKRCHVLRAIRMEAERDLAALREVCGSAIMFMDDAVWRYNMEQLKCGYQGKPGVRKYRVLVTLRLAVQLFEGASVEHFRQFGTVRCRMAELPQVSSLCARSTTAWKREWPEWRQMGIVEEDKAVLEVQAVELALDYTKHRERVELQPTGCSHKAARDMLKMWSKVLISTKRAQMQNEKTGDWPSVAMRPLKITRFGEMPVVLWILENQPPEVEVVRSEFDMPPWSV